MYRNQVLLSVMGKAFVLMLVQQVIPMESPAMEPVHVAALALIDCFK